MTSFDSELFRRATNRSQPALAHPTSARFDAGSWSSALASIGAPTERDVDLCRAARFFGRQIASARQQFGRLFSPLSPALAVRLMVAQANRECLAIQARMGRQIHDSKRRGDPPHIERVATALIYSGRTGQRQTADALIESLIDTLPHWYFHALRLAAPSETIADAQIGVRAAVILQFMSVEHIYRDLWQQTLWQGRKFTASDGRLLLSPSNEENEQRWLKWVLRQQALRIQRRLVDGGGTGTLEAPPPERLPLLQRSVVRMEQASGKRRKPVVASLPHWGRQQRRHLSDWVTIEGSYLQPMVHDNLPKLAPHPVSVAVVFRAWAVLRDLVELMLSECPRKALSSHQAVYRFSFPIASSDLVATIGRSLGVSPEIASCVVTFLEATGDTTHLFRRGFWSSPLIRAPERDAYYLLAPAILYADLVRCAEQWLEKGGGATDLQVKGRHFEEAVRVQLAEALKANEVLTDAECLGCQLAPDGAEEIDAIARIGNTILVLEAKCFVSPADPIDRYTFLGKLDEACDQVKRKAEWLGAHRSVLTGLFGWDEARTSLATIAPVVVTNQSYGIGYSANNVPVVDLHYLKLLFETSTYVAAGALRFRDGFHVPMLKNVYDSQSDLEARLGRLLDRPIVLNRFDGLIKFHRLPIPTHSDTSFETMIPILDGVPFPGTDAELRAMTAAAELN